jgi:SEC-C motif domain protein
MKPQTQKAANCPCGGLSYQSCCAPIHAGAPARTAEQLMRSRYCAYVMQLEEYLLATWHESRRPEVIEFDARTRWLGLSVLAQSEAADSAQVEFIARYAEGGGRAQRLHEVSRFARVDSHWFYVDGIVD